LRPVLCPHKTGSDDIQGPRGQVEQTTSVPPQQTTSVRPLCPRGEAEKVIGAARGSE